MGERYQHPAEDEDALEDELLQDFLAASQEFARAEEDKKETAKARYRMTLERFTQFVVYNKRPQQ